MIAAVLHLDAGVRATLAEHFLALPMRDRTLRFGGGVAPEFIARYVDAIDFDDDAVFGIHDDRSALVGVAHVAFDGGRAEVALSVLPAHRRRGFGGALFARAAAHARSRSVSELIMHFLAENVPIMRIALKFGMRIVRGAGEADACLALPPASMMSMASEFATDTFAYCDRALNGFVAALGHRQRGRAPAPDARRRPLP
jgi:GNAT superfamily N-acetyltransferase